MTRARGKLVLTGAARRRVFGDYQATEPSRFIDEVPAELVERITPSFSSGYQGHFPHYEFRTNPYGRGRRGRVREEEATYAYENEDQSSIGSGLRPGMKVRHTQFGVGTVISVERLDDDTKLVVRFADVGQKTLRAKYARLELA